MSHKLVLTLLVASIVIAFVPNTKFYFGFDLRILYPDPLPLPESFSGPLLTNRLLSKADKLYLNEIRGPESFAIWQDKVYTSLSDGRIVQVLEDSLRTIAFLDPNQLGLQECRKQYNAGRCGRPLGLKFDSNGNLYTVDPYNGLFSIDVQTGKTLLIIGIEPKTGLGARFLDDLAVLEKENGHLIFYMSDASTEWDLFDVPYLVTEHDCSGRLLSYDTESGQVKVELDRLPFPNGLTLTDDKRALLICSFNHRLIYKYQLKGFEKGNLKTWISNLPGEPDNIKRSRDPNRETYWVALYTARNRHMPHWAMDTLANYGYLRRYAMRTQRLVGYLVQQIASLFDNDYWKNIGFDIKTGEIMNQAISYYGMAIEIDSDGRLVHSLHSPDQYIRGLSEVFETKQTDTERHFYLGSFSNTYLGKLVLPKNVFGQKILANSSSHSLLKNKINLEKSNNKQQSKQTSQNDQKPEKRQNHKNEL